MGNGISSSDDIHEIDNNVNKIPDAPPLPDTLPPLKLVRQEGYYKESKLGKDVIVWSDYETQLADIRNELKQLHELHKVSTSKIQLSPNTADKLWDKRLSPPSSPPASVKCLTKKKKKKKKKK